MLPPAFYTMSCYNVQSNLAEGGATFVFASCKQQFAIACCGWGFYPQTARSLEGKVPHVTQCVIGAHKRTCQMASNQTV